MELQIGKSVISTEAASFDGNDAIFNEVLTLAVADASIDTLTVSLDCLNGEVAHFD